MYMSVIVHYVSSTITIARLDTTATMIQYNKPMSQLTSMGKGYG